MSTLHTVSQSPGTGSALTSCLRLSARGSAVLLIEDAVIAALEGASSEPSIAAALTARRILALEPDLVARGFRARDVLPGVELVDYSGFVDLCTEYSKVLAWY